MIELSNIVAKYPGGEGLDQVNLFTLLVPAAQEKAVC